MARIAVAGCDSDGSGGTLWIVLRENGHEAVAISRSAAWT